MRLFGRSIRVSVIQPASGSFTAGTLNVTEIEGLDVSATITKTLSKEPNTAELQIYNLNADSRVTIAKKPLKIVVEAGYDNVLKQIFVGDIRWAPSYKDGADWVTKLQLADGGRLFSHAWSSKSYVGGVAVKTLLADITKDMGLRLPRIVNEDPVFLQQYASGFVSHGKSSDILSRVLAPIGYSWSIQDEQLQFLKEDTVRANQLILISQDSGLVGVPELGAPGKKGEPPILTAKTLLYPEVLPGAKIRLQSASLNGDFKVQRVTHSLDTAGTDWYTEMEAKPL